MLAFYMSMTIGEEQKQTFGEIYMENRNAFYKAAVGILRNEQDAEDAVQEAFMYIAKNIKKIGAIPVSERHSMLIVILRNAAIDIYRKNQKERERTEPITDNDASVTVDFFEGFEYSELRSAISELPPMYKDIVYLYFVRELKARKIAKLLGISADTVYKRVERAKLLLKEKLSERRSEYEEQQIQKSTVR